MSMATSPSTPFVMGTAWVATWHRRPGVSCRCSPQAEMRRCLQQSWRLSALLVHLVAHLVIYGPCGADVDDGSWVKSKLWGYSRLFAGWDLSCCRWFGDTCWSPEHSLAEMQQPNVKCIPNLQMDIYIYIYNTTKPSFACGMNILLQATEFGFAPT